MRVADEGLLPLLPTSPGRGVSALPVQTYGSRSQRHFDTNAIGRDRGGEGAFVGEFPPVAAFPSLPENRVDEAGNPIAGSLASSRGFVSAGSPKSSRGFLSRTLATARKGADLAGLPSGGMRFFANPTIEEPLVASVGTPAAPSSDPEKREGSKGRPAPVDTSRSVPIAVRRDEFSPSSPSLNSPLSPNSVSFEERLEKKAGVALHTLHLGDLRRSKSLRVEMQALKLHDYFDTRGTPRFRRLGLSFAAKQNAEVKDSFGSIIKNEDHEANKRTFSARSYFSATQAILKDIHHGEELKLQTLKAVDEMERFRVEDVQVRQLEMLFLEVPDFQHYMPDDVARRELIPPTIDKDAEIRERKSSERSTSYLADTRWVEGRRMGWMMTRQEALMLSDFSVLWTRASRTNNCPFGMDRPTFCRMILDLGLIDQKKVPYYWAVSLFDSMAQAVRCCPPDATWSNTAPSAFVVNRWALLSIFDTLLRQHFDENNKDRFFVTLQQVAAANLPAHLSASVQELIKRNQPPPDAKSKPARGKNGQRALEQEDGKANKSITAGSKFRNKVQAAQVHFKMLANVMVGLQKAGDLEIDDDGTKNINNLMKPEEDDKVEKKDDQQEEHVAIPAWLKPPELSAPNLDTAIERLARERLVGGMLVEPEVLHLVAEFHAPFREMHRIYSESNGHMSFPMLLQFCTDFRLTPQLVSSDLLQGAYASVQTLEVDREAQEFSRQTSSEASPPPSAKLPLKPKEDEMPQEPLSPRYKARKSMKAGGRKDFSKYRTFSGVDRQGSSQSLADAEKSPNTNDRSIKRSSTGALSKMESVSKRDSTQDDKAPVQANAGSEHDKPRVRLSGELKGDGESPREKRRLSLPNVVRSIAQAQAQARMDRRRSSEGNKADELARLESLAEAPPQAPPAPPPPPVWIFGVGAFLEVLCRVAFVHLGSYGNIVQQSSTAYARVVWLITYLRYTFDHLKVKTVEFAATGRTHKAPDRCKICRKPLEPSHHFCRECGSKVPEDPAVPPLLQKALQELPRDWASPPATVPKEIPLGEVVVHPEPGIGCKRKRRRGRQNTCHPRLAPSMHTSPSIRKKLHKLALSAQENVAERKKTSDVGPGNSSRKRSSMMRSRSKEPASSDTDARRVSLSNTCECGSVFLPDAVFCRKCGTKRPEKASEGKAASDKESSSRPESVSSLQDPSSSDESLHDEEKKETEVSRKKEIETPVAKGRRVSSNKATHADVQRQTRALLEKADAQKESWSLDELFEAEAGKSAVLDGRCSICEGEVHTRQWGNARCRGCSIVDHLPFEHHPFKLALKERPKLSTEPSALATDLPPGIERYGLTPPPVGDLNSVLRKYFGHSQDSIEAIN